MQLGRFLARADYHAVVLLVSRGVSSEVAMRSIGWLKSVIGSIVVVTFVVVSVTRVFITGWHNFKPEGPGVDLYLPSIPCKLPDLLSLLGVANYIFFETCKPPHPVKEKAHRWRFQIALRCHR